MNAGTVIAISRQYGSGGRELAQILAKKLGIPLYDRQLIHIAAAKIGIDDMKEGDLKQLEEEIPPLSLKFMPFYIFGMQGEKPLNNQMFEAESEAIRQLARDGSCIILGRCADYVLKNFPNTYSFYICADDAYRAERGKSIYDGKTLRELKEEDRKRGQYYTYYTGNLWGDPANYTAAMNTSRITLDKGADLIINYIETLQQ
ncbi:AAA family ATPase [Megasphaera sp. DISK 18]|uniref:cytidylate kinase-like family protein n=1 Tax=Megasphaera sp. DISK 18 TaxID=1776081 RepID=UPI0008071530|nr:cytidylate kinase-like family protein [Megasphaera sp. DISK 18]OBZ32203.1 cytidylate kinase [Megasphaera sp. DISK 18]